MLPQGYLPTGNILLPPEDPVRATVAVLVPPLLDAVPVRTLFHAPSFSWRHRSRFIRKCAP